MNTRCIAASHNKDKIREISEILEPFGIEVLAAKDAGPVLDVEETAKSFEGNARLKAEAYRALYPESWVLADDSGLCVDGLGGMPGIYSARFGGEDSDYQRKSALIWKGLREKGIPEEDWSARFVCAICLFEPAAESPHIFRGEMEGRIIPEMRGAHGFGYDPIFYLPEYKMTSAEIDPALKNKISHRGRALAKVRAFLASKDMTN